MNVTIDAAANVTVNGVAKGHVLDAVRNDPLLAADIKAAFDQAWLAQMVLARDAQAAAQASIADVFNAHDRALLLKDDERVAAVAATRAEYDPIIAELSSQVDALGGTELGQRMAKQKALDEAQAALDDAAARVVAAQQALGVATVDASPKEITP